MDEPPHCAVEKYHYYLFSFFIQATGGASKHCSSLMSSFFKVSSSAYAQGDG